MSRSAFDIHYCLECSGSNRASENAGGFHDRKWSFHLRVLKCNACENDNERAKFTFVIYLLPSVKAGWPCPSGSGSQVLPLWASG